jgi:hypothetical protein
MGGTALDQVISRHRSSQEYRQRAQRIQGTGKDDLKDGQRDLRKAGVSICLC